MQKHIPFTVITIRVYNLLAVILADGSVDFGARYTITFTEQPEVVQRLIREFDSINGLRIVWKTDRLHNSLRARAYGKDLTNVIGRLVKTTRTRKFETYPKSPTSGFGYPRIKLPRPVFENKDVASEFLRYYSTCDGGPEFQVYRRTSGPIQLSTGIKIGCFNPYLRKELKALFKRIGLQASEGTDGLEISSLEGMEKFRQFIGFLEESRVRRGKLFRGFLKNDIVDLMIICRRISKKRQWINRNFKQVEPFESFLKKCLRSIRDADRLRELFLTIGLDPNPSPMDLAENSHVR